MYAFTFFVIHTNSLEDVRQDTRCVHIIGIFSHPGSKITWKITFINQLEFDKRPYKIL